MNIKHLPLIAALAVAGTAWADISNGPNPYLPGYGFDTPTEATWGGWTRGTAGTVYAEWDRFSDASYGGSTDRTAAPDVGSANASGASLGWNSGVFVSSTTNLYSFSVDEAFSISLASTTDLGSTPIRVVLQVETWGVALTGALLNGVAPTLVSQTFAGVIDTSIGEAFDYNLLYVWDLAAAPTSYAFALTSPVHTSLTQVAIDIAAAPVPEPGTYAMLLAGLGIVASLARRRRVG
jgi:hypothetical protein